jgi:hypothetical protein
MVQGHSSIAKPIPQSAMVRPHPSTIAKPIPQSFEAFVMERFKRNEKEVGDRSYITQYELCKNCHGLNTSGVVVTDKGDKICRKCFKASSVTKTAATRVCNKCKTDQTSKWYTDRLAVGHICKACYTKRRTCPKFDGLEVERRCTQCMTNHSSLWYQDHFTANGYICIECHDTRKKPKK